MVCSNGATYLKPKYELYAEIAHTKQKIIMLRKTTLLFKIRTTPPLMNWGNGMKSITETHTRHTSPHKIRRGTVIGGMRGIATRLWCEGDSTTRLHSNRNLTHCPSLSMLESCASTQQCESPRAHTVARVLGGTNAYSL
mmetsp:Transcript_11608/g.43601  ORF Transcript_11608/g.43601 Transcript_11608/m.43601 type:complete len:139 (+) Transcript_11608:333-749(+)